MTSPVALVFTFKVGQIIKPGQEGLKMSLRSLAALKILHRLREVPFTLKTMIWSK